MKKILSLILCSLLVIGSIAVFGACSRQEEEKEKENNKSAGQQLVGGWTVADSTEITDEFKAVFEKATKEYTGCDLLPVLYLSSQVVAGTNHCALCKSTPVVPNAKTTYALVYIYEDLQGNAEITEVQSSEVEIIDEALDGGWTQSDSPEVSDEAKKALESASSTLTGAELSPFALLSTQAAATTNYRLLCKETATVPNAESEWAIVTLSAKSDGTGEILEINEFEKQ